MAELMEEGLHFIVGQERRLVQGRLGEITDQRRQWLGDAAVRPDLVLRQTPLCRMAVFIVARMKVEVEVAQPLARCGVVHLEEAHIIVPKRPARIARRGRHFLVLQAVQQLRDAEQPFDHALQGEVLADLLRVHRIFRLLEPVLIEGHIPWKQFGI